MSAWTPTPTATPSRCSSRTAGGPPRTPPATCCPRCARASTCSTSAAGPGTITVDLAARVAPGRVVGLDVSADPLAEARAAAERAGVAVTFEVGDVYALAAADDSFDVVHAHQVLQHLTDPVAALREMARVCRPGGVIAVRDVDYAATSWFPAGRRPDRWLDAVRRGGPAQRRASPTPAGGCCRGRTRRGCGTSSPRRRPGASRRRPSASGGATRGPDGRRRRRSRSRRWPTGWRRPAELEEIAAAWLRWRDADDGWLGMLHGELLIRV